MGDSAATGHRERLRNRFLAGADGSESDVALLELLLTYAIPRQDVRPLAERLIARFGSLEEVLRADLATLCEVKGIQAPSAVLLKAIHSVASRCHEQPEADLSPVAAPRPPQPVLFDPSSLDGHVAGTERQNDPVDAAPDLAPGESPLAPSPALGVPGEPAALGDTPEEPGRSARGAMLFGQAVLQEAVDLLPGFPNTEALSDIKAFLQENLHFSGEETRYRRANAIIRRMFPHGKADSALRVFARAYPDTQELRDVCFYRFCKAEPLMTQVVTDLILPNIGSGTLERQRIRQYLVQRFPAARKNTIDATYVGIVDALTAAGVARVDRKTLTFAYRRVLLPSLAFLVHSEFPEPGLHDLSALEQSQALRAMLWNPDQVLPALYELRNQGILARLSEIDQVRQFSTKWTLDEAVAAMAPVESRA
jgi:hypothetical protein